MGAAPEPSNPDLHLTEEQEAAFQRTRSWYNDPSSESFFSLTGPAGTGKTTLVREIVRHFPFATLAAMTGKAAIRLSDTTKREARTLHSILYFPPDREKGGKFEKLREPPNGLFVIVDEASMIAPGVFEDMQKWADKGVRFLLVGDPYQLPPVDKENDDDYSVFSQTDGVLLKTVMRSAGGVLRAATYTRENGIFPVENDDGYELVMHSRPIEAAVHDYVSDMDDHLLVTWKNSTRMRANRLVRHLLGKTSDMPEPGEPILIRRNMPKAGIFNGEVLTNHTGFRPGPTIAGVPTMYMDTPTFTTLVYVNGGQRNKGGEHFDGQMPWIDNWREYTSALKRSQLEDPVPITWGYCLTAHAVQGSEARRVTVFLDHDEPASKNFKKTTRIHTGEELSFRARWLYTALSRGKKRATMVIGR